MSLSLSPKLYTSFPALKTGKLLLRELTSSDASAYLQYMNTPEVSNFITADNIPKTISQAHDEIRYWSGLFYKRVGIYWGISNENSSRIVGTIGFNFISAISMRGDISYDLDSNFWGNGIMNEALQKVLEFADSAGIVRVQATVNIDNLRSIKLLEKRGFKQEGLLKSYENIQGELKDYYMYARIAS